MVIQLVALCQKVHFSLMDATAMHQHCSVVVQICSASCYLLWMYLTLKLAWMLFTPQNTPSLINAPPTTQLPPSSLTFFKCTPQTILNKITGFSYFSCWDLFNWKLTGHRTTVVIETAQWRQHKVAGGFEIPYDSKLTFSGTKPLTQCPRSFCKARIWIDNFILINAPLLKNFRP